MKYFLLLIVFMFLICPAYAQSAKTIVLNPPDISQGMSVMKALTLRSSASNFDTTQLTLQDLSDLLWAANGINRPDQGKRTAPSAVNAQDIDVYVSLESGMYLYDAKKHVLVEVAEGDHRKLVAARQDYVARAPVICILVSDISKFRFGADSLKMILAAEDAGIVSQNISIFCASRGLLTRPRMTMDMTKLRDLLKLKNSQYLMLNNPVSRKK